MKSSKCISHTILGAVLAAALGGCAGESDSSPESDIGAAEVAPSEEAQQRDSRQTSEVMKSAVVQYQPKGPQVGDPLYPSESKEGFAWLQRHEYPTNDEMRGTHNRVAQLSSINLNDGISSTELLDLEALAIADKEGSNEATELLNKAVAMGSMYALEVLGRVYEAQGNLVWARAYFQAAQIRGNWSVALRMKPSLSQVEVMIAEVMAQQIIDKANEARARNGLPPLTYDPRPGAERALIAISEQIRMDQELQMRGGEK